eukprot:CAMPEP_0206179082 /NCGR_PEP_ID=MMETSP1474-20131121/66442_1 /ASSEMBLY_ACC=CAM_ASM_001110 /TAXON_ID=97495 /ORGANISM="Imantonia sp., Strain RCC918" /LENGTH=111 /DNA_ID=CAMNT_0053592121 /DNA_START=255 /DNA_END=590 /DNA_ORIENTATION=-
MAEEVAVGASGVRLALWPVVDVVAVGRQVEDGSDRVGQVADKCLVVEDHLVVELVVVPHLVNGLDVPPPQLLLHLHHALQPRRIECTPRATVPVGIFPIGAAVRVAGVREL